MTPLAICAIFRDEARYLDEWVGFHRASGAEHFFLYDNESTDAPREVLSPLIEAGCVTLIPWPTPFHHGAQKKAYVDCLERTRRRFRWVAFIDIDEFLFSPTGRPLPEVLGDFEPFPGVLAHWQCYGSNGHRTASGAPVTERFCRRAPTQWVRNRRVKSIVDPERAAEPVSVHLFAYRNGERPVDESRRRLEYHAKPRFKRQIKRVCKWFGPLLHALPLDPYAGISVADKLVRVDLLRINHYPVKSYEEFLRKARFQKERRRYDDVDYFAFHDRNEVYDPILVGFAEKIATQYHPMPATALGLRAAAIADSRPDLRRE